MKSFAPPWKETKHLRLSCRFITYSIRIGDLEQYKYQKQPFQVFCEKRVFLKISQNSQGTPVPEETPVNFAKFLRTSFLQNDSGRLLLKADIATAKQEIQIVFVVESWMQYLLLRPNPRAQGKNLTIKLLWASALLLVARVSRIYLIDEFFFWFQCS